ncbi:MAG: hypothetical protein Q8O87_03045 [bacterium]|nr:hypothetical protein [bacterium]
MGLHSLSLYVVAAAIASIFLMAWVVVLSLSAPKKTTPNSTIAIAFVVGVASAFLAIIVEQAAYLSNIGLELFSPDFSATTLHDLINAAIFAFAFVAVVEEGIKFLILKH